MGYSKFFSTLLDSTLWDEDHATVRVWVTMILMADQDGVVLARTPGIAKRARVSMEECEKALKVFSSPDPHSKSRDQEGRRALETDEGWQIVNYEKYRDMMSEGESKAKNAERQARFRDRHGIKKTDVTPVTLRNVTVTDVTLARSDSQSVSVSVLPFSDLWAEWPGPQEIRFTEVRAEAEAAYNENITDENWAEFRKAFELVLNAYHASKDKDRRKVLGSFREFCKERWKNFKPLASDPVQGPAPERPKVELAPNNEV